MKIIELYIYGFGKLNNIKIKGLTDFQVFYGENEAGKSTIMAFIHGVLFGFPTKQQSTELRYEPKHDTKYGGKLIIDHEEHGYTIIERVKGKAAGDVSVTLKDGTVGGEDLLKQVLLHMDKGLFQAIFSFNLQGLQNINQMKGEELGKFLFSAGTLGTERLAKTETVLLKELETHFKPSGKKPILNEKLKAIHELNGELKKAAIKNQQYEERVKEKEWIQQEKERLNHSLYEVQVKLEKQNEWKKIHTFVKEEKWTKNEIKQIGEFPFPVRGIERLEKLNQLIYPLNAQISSLDERISHLKTEINAIQPDQHFLESESAITAILEQVPLYEQLNLERQQCETKLVEIEEKLSMLNEKLHLPIEQEEVLLLNTNIYMKDQVEKHYRKSQKLLEVKQELEDNFRDEKNSMEDLEEKVRFAESQLLTGAERARLEKILSVESDKKSVELELKSVQDQIEFYRLADERDKKTMDKLHKQRRIQFFIIELILIILSLYGLFSKQWVLLFFSITVCFLIGVFMSKNLHYTGTPDTKKRLNQFIQKEKELSKQLDSFHNMNITDIKERLTIDNRRREQLQLLKMKLEQQHTQYEKVISKFEEWEIEEAANKENILKISSQLKIPEYIANSFFLEAFQLIEQYKGVVREKRQIEARLENIKRNQAKIKETLDSFTGQFIENKSGNLQKNAYILRNKLKEEHEKQIKSQEKLAKLYDLEADKQQIQQEQAHLNFERIKLINEANVKTEQEFYELGNTAEKKQKLTERLEDLKKQLQYTILTEDERESFLKTSQFDELIRKYNEDSQKLSDNLVILQEKQASVKYDIQILEEGGGYSELLHQYKQKKFELEEAAKEWSVYSLAQEILSRTIEKYKTVYLPRMLAKAEEYLCFLTDGNYHKIHLQNSGTGFLIERRDHTLFEANELSQATTEQIYVSIRLALVTTLYERYPLPIIIDDSFVNFDAKRTKKMMELLKRFKHNQILFFTCHPHLLDHFEKEKVFYLNKNAVKVI